MSLVRELPRFSNPGHCIMFAGRRKDERGFYLFDNVVDGPNGDIHIGISGEGLRNIASKHGDRFGIALREDLELAQQARRDAENLLLQAQARIEELESFKASLSGVAAEGFIIKKRTGRPATKTEEN